jgi:hypothetical protein
LSRGVEDYSTTYMGHFGRSGSEDWESSDEEEKASGAISFDCVAEPIRHSHASTLGADEKIGPADPASAYGVLEYVPYIHPVQVDRKEIHSTEVCTWTPCSLIVTSRRFGPEANVRDLSFLTDNQEYTQLQDRPPTKGDS